MSIPERIQLPKGGLPDKPGVYTMKNAGGEVIYVGKASVLKRRVTSYWRIHEQLSRHQVADLIAEVAKIEVEVTPTVLEALILEANRIKQFKPKYNIMQKDDKSFLYLAISKDPYPKPLFVRGHDLEQEGTKKYKAVFGPYLQPMALRAALKLVRKFIPWSTCTPPEPGKRKRACFDYHIGACPGVCIGTISKQDYAKVIHHLILFFEGKAARLKNELEKDMKRAAKELRFEEAEQLKRQVYALEHINDVAILTKEESAHFGHPRKSDLTINVFGRIEGYDISNISGTSAVGSMVVFKDGEPKKSQYRKFRIKTVQGANDYAMLREVLTRRFTNDWPKPDLILIDGGWGQVNIAKDVLLKVGAYSNTPLHEIPIVGIAKGFDRKQDRLIYSRSNPELGRIVEQYKVVLQRLRDEAHRFAIGYHRKLRSKRGMG